MADRLEFRQKLNGILKTAENSGSKITLEEVEKYFEEDGLSLEQMELVCDYLLAQKVTVRGYRKKGGKVTESETNLKQLKEEEEIYLSNYLNEIKDSEKADPRLAFYLNRVVSAARELYHTDVFIGDVIQEGNVSLMVALSAYGQQEGADSYIEDAVREGIQVFIESQTEEKKKDNKIVERVEDLEESIKNLKKELEREVTVEELAFYLNAEEEEIHNLLKLEGEANK